MVNSSSSEQHFSNILKKLHDNNAHTRAFSYLICRALLARLSGQRLVDSAHQLLVAMNLKSLEGMDEFMEGIDNLEIVGTYKSSKLFCHLTFGAVPT